MASSDGALGTTAQFFADLGGSVIALSVLALGVVPLVYSRRSPLPLVLAVLAAVAVPLLVLPLKFAMARTGPDGAPLGDYAGYYPSGHAATAALAYGTLMLLYGGSRRTPYAAVVLLNIAVGAGLVLRGYHWASDVVASWALAVLVMCALTLLSGRFLPSRPSARLPRASPVPEPQDR
ncbi:phosphatase PAP2 family protein [Streptomyces sp. N2-109]|uniref:Phosphatase PAP2 family protein n=1 Tax=Streptomyces gossypii TaxID=2883101 RepID=A0ABT2K1Z9_9ACTN|nr:phosphatase PAP2 family protein [Streptomyces gossypii]MCT2594195.1 phosphatase PAP2 family protein [Streptomyces gossypii]